MASTILTQDYMNTLDEKHAAVFRDKQYNEIHLLTLDIIELLRRAKRHALSDEQALAGVEACVKIREILDAANVDKLNKYMEHKEINESESE